MSRRKKKLKERDSGRITAWARVSTAWDHYWYAPVDAIRPYLFLKIILFLLPFDLWILRPPIGALYGLHGFNVSHFAWLDMIQPLPTSQLYLGLLLSTGILSLICAFVGANSWVLALLALSYTYTWSMSMLDNYQHHYFLSLILIAFTFFPCLRLQNLYEQEETGQSQIIFHSSSRDRAIVSSWAYKLVAVNVSMIYAFTALTKITEKQFHQAQFVRYLAREDLVPVLEKQLEGIGMPPEFFWQAIALSAITIELILALSYLCSTILNKDSRRWLRLMTYSGFMAALIFHTANEFFLSLSIGWFSYYMLAIAAIYLLPAPFLLRIGRYASWFVRRLAYATMLIPSTLNTISSITKILMTVIFVFIATSITVILCLNIDLPGVLTTGLLIAGILFVVCMASIAAGFIRHAMRYAAVTSIAIILMWIAITESTVRFSFYERVGYNYQFQGDTGSAVLAFEKAMKYIPAWKKTAKSKEEGA